MIQSTDLTAPVGMIVDTLFTKYGGNQVPVDAVDETLGILREPITQLFPGVVDIHFPQIRLQVLERIQITLDHDDNVAIAEAHEPWLEASVAGGEIELKRWYNYKQYLKINGLTPQVIDTIDEATSEIVDLVGDPTSTGHWKRRGLVIGDVQSGKTATYIGILNKASDAGYKLIILLAGGTESLRKQTQFRIDDGLIGRDSSIDAEVRKIGVGNFATDFVPAQGLTTHASDFNKSSKLATSITIDQASSAPYVFVLKKNKTALENVIQWLRGQFDGSEHLDIPMLVVDDESDYASVDTNYGRPGDKDPTIINQRIRELLKLTTKSSYVAFTATPFANVFIDHETQHKMLADDLFPSDYIYALASPSNYMGASRYFDDEADSLEYIADAAEIFPLRHKSHLPVEDLPESLLEAVNAFIVASAIRELRGDSSPRSMLINVSRFKNVQRQAWELVSDAVASIKSAVELHSGSEAGDANAAIAALRQTLIDVYPDLEQEWPEIRSKLLAGVTGLTVQLINSDRAKDADNGRRRMIAVGGDVLSRGLTLDGLTVSYFYRTVGAADTLLQMARWFGYRPGYEDLVRVWIDEDVAAQFRYVADIGRELRAQLADMRRLNKLPRDFGLMIRRHPESLAITAKRGASESRKVVISLAARNIETPRIPAHATVVGNNYDATIKFLKQITEGGSGWGKVGKHTGIVDVDRVHIANFLDDFTFDTRNLVLGGSSLSHAIRNKQGPKFQNWRVALVRGSGEPLKLTPQVTLASRIKRTVRLAGSDGSPVFKVGGNSLRVAGTKDLAASFAGQGDDMEEPAVYAHLPAPTLLLYVIEPLLPLMPQKNESADKAKEDSEMIANVMASLGERPPVLIALKIAIQGKPDDTDADVTYQVNSPWLQQYRAQFELAKEDRDDVDE